MGARGFENLHSQLGVVVAAAFRVSEFNVVVLSSSQGLAITLIIFAIGMEVIIAGVSSSTYYLHGIGWVLIRGELKRAAVVARELEPVGSSCGGIEVTFPHSSKAFAKVSQRFRVYRKRHIC